MEVPSGKAQKEETGAELHLAPHRQRFDDFFASAEEHRKEGAVGMAFEAPPGLGVALRHRRGEPIDVYRVWEDPATRLPRPPRSSEEATWMIDDEQPFVGDRVVLSVHNGKITAMVHTRMQDGQRIQTSFLPIEHLEITLTAVRAQQRL